ncbi:hypothetical protein Slin15195_G008390 [Septoria linicola]|uniref:Peroxin 20 n=1 Tax=Septoria linicola TaxID=215465 RepID=A0A9Q9EE54_9PEZI|nr:hypothetical protein Slin15195_G008390 [Septoria linicola]
MAAAECGPSNGLQRFKQHTDVDRTLQQDRLTSRSHPAQGFRSANPNAALLDPEFDAFQAAVDLSLHDHHHAQFAQHGHFAAPSQAPSWATDFQRMAISQPTASMHHSQPQFAPQPSTAGWAQGFQQHIAQAAPRQQNSSSSPQAFQQRARYGLTGFQSQFAQPNYASPMIQSKGKAPMQADQFDEAAFAAAFDQAHDDLMADVEDTAQEQVPTAQELLDEMEAEKFETAVEEAASHILQEDGHDLDIEEVHPMARTHSADIEHEPFHGPQEERQEHIIPHHDDDALAATAEELLEKVKHNQSEKFKNSQFLALMRKLKDREVRVEGDKMVETANATSAQTADTTLNASSTSTERLYHGDPQLAPLPVDTRPPDYGIPLTEQDHDAGRVDPRDGQDVVNLLNQAGPVTDDMGTFDSP